MTLHITQIRVGQTMQVSLAGSLTWEEAEHLLRSYSNAVRPWSLDLSELLTADEAGIGALRELRAKGVELLHAKPYVAMLLNPNGQQGDGSDEQPE